MDGKAFGEEVVGIVRGYVERALAPLVAENESLTRRVAELEARPAPERGEKGDPGERGLTGERGADGVGLAGALIDRRGVLVLTLTNGETRELGQVVGKDGNDGRDGVDGKPGETFTIDDFDVEPVDERTIRLGFTKGAEKHTFELEFPVLVGRGVWQAGHEYARGDVVTWGGSAWESVEPKGLKPDAAESGWRLMVKRGRDGKDKA